MVSSIIGIIAYIFLAPLVGGLLDGIDRKISARMQGRIGPPLLQPFYDVRKLLCKEILVINNIQYLFAWCFIIFIVFTGALFFGGYNMLLMLFVLTTAAMFLVLEASSTNSPFADIGANRELIQMISYEPMVLLTAVGFYIATRGSFSVKDIILYSNVPNIIYLPGVFIGFVFILTIKMRKKPFDIAMSHHAHQEIVSGVTTELSGGMLALVNISHWYENILLLGIVALFFLSNRWWSIPLAVVVCLAVYLLEILISNTNARVKWDRMFTSSWLMTIVFGAVNLFILQMIL